jgi:hypothetical protein
MTIQNTKLRSVEFKTHPSNELSLENRGNYLQEYHFSRQLVAGSWQEVPRSAYGCQFCSFAACHKLPVTGYPATA